MLLVAMTMAMLIWDQPAAQAQPQATPPSRSARNNDPERVVCRREHTIGSNRPVRTCRTAREWEEIRQYSMQFHSSADRQRPNVSNKAGGGDPFGHLKGEQY